MPQSFLPFALPDVGDAELQALKQTLESGWLTTGPLTKRFEAKFANAVGAKHAVAVNSCTAAMHLALAAIGLEPGDEVITTPYTFAATAEVVRYFGAHPIFVDIDPVTFNMDPALLHDAVSPRTKAIIPVHIAGVPAEMDAVRRFAVRHGLYVIEDAAHAFPAAYKDRTIGAGSDFVCFSFYATKTLTTGEGGMLCTGDAEWADRCRQLALHGISRDAWNRYSAEGSWYYEITEPGYKYNMTDLSASIGLVQLDKAEAMWLRRWEIADMYDEAFARNSVFQIPSRGEEIQHAWHLYMLRLNNHGLTISRADFIRELNARGIGASVHFIPLHLHPYYREAYGHQPSAYPVAWREYQREISLPIYSRMTDADVRRVIAAVLDVARVHSTPRGKRVGRAA